MNALRLDKNGITYLFRYADGCEDEIVGELIRQAGDPRSGLDWLDAATLSFQVVSRVALDCPLGQTLEGLD